MATCITANIGSYDADIIPPLFQGQSYYVTDNVAIATRAQDAGWNPIVVDPVSTTNNKLLARLGKAMPQVFVSADDEHPVESIAWLDANVRKKGRRGKGRRGKGRRGKGRRGKGRRKPASLPEIPNADMVGLRHQGRNSIRQEASTVIGKGVELASHVERVMGILAQRKYPDTRLTTCFYSVRLKPFDARVLKFGGTWWRGMHLCRRDQITFDYAIWKHRVLLQRESASTIKRRSHNHKNGQKRIRHVRPALTIVERLSFVEHPEMGNTRLITDLPSVSPAQHMVPGWTLVVCGSPDQVDRVIRWRADAMIVLVQQADAELGPDVLELLHNNLIEGIVLSAPSQLEQAQAVSHYCGTRHLCATPAELPQVLASVGTALEALPI